jgi:hypothetical protein
MRFVSNPGFPMLNLILRSTETLASNAVKIDKLIDKFEQYMDERDGMVY